MHLAKKAHVVIFIRTPMSVYEPQMPSKSWPPGRSWPLFIVLTLVLLWVIHAVAFFPHEYAHSFSAWLLGWKTNPLALDYGGLNTGNIVAQFDIDENVDYDPIFAAHHDVEAAFIAVAGMAIGNGLTYLVSRWGYRRARKDGARTWALACYWLCVASVGNFIDYVPIRTFTTHGDMHTVERGLHCSPWWVAIILGVPGLLAVFHFLLRLAPDALRWLFPDSRGRRNVMVVLTSFAVFGFYGAAVGWSGYGPTAHVLGVICGCVLLPLYIVWGLGASHAMGDR
jgi:hypothetical protein